ncbi:19959_t:CDS:1, partial [Dentiscutata erythropus]
VTKLDNLLLYFCIKTCFSFKGKLNMSSLVNYDSDETLSEPDRKSSHEICHLAETIKEINKKQEHNEYTITLQKERIEHEQKRDDANRD